MVTGHLLSEELADVEIPARNSQSVGASRALLQLMQLARRAEIPNDSSELAGIVSPAVLRSLMSALHYRDVATVRHSRRVAMISTGIARVLGWEGRDLKLLEVASLVHDIGKIGVPDNILFKPGKLNQEEQELMELHYNIGVDVLQATQVDRDVIEIVSQSQRHNGESVDVARQSRSEPHQGARILAVADAYDSLSTDQVYRDGMPYRKILLILMDAAGARFDGNIVCTLARWIETEGVPFTEGNADFGAVAPSSAPVQPEETLEANSLCQVFSYLYMLESLYDAFYLVDSDMRLIIWNRGAEKLLKRSAWDMLGKVWSSRLIPYADRSDQPLADEAYPMKRVAASERATIENLHLLNPEGSSTEVELQTVPLLGETGGLQGVAEIFRDSSRPSHRPQEYRDLKLAASRDPLTNLSNRGELETQLALMVSDYASQSDPEPFSVMFLDVDFFKSINDTHGHTVGDAVLVDVARHLQQETYSGELVARYGGEEFVVLCPETRMDDVIKRAERIRSSLGRTPVGNESHLKVTASFGVTEIEPGDSVESVLSRADMAIYQAKEDGRDKTRSLTHADQLLGKKQPEAEPVEVDPFVYNAAFTACIGADMIAYKLGGFVNDLDATLVEVAPKRAVIRLGKKSLFPMWGMTDDRRPVELEIEFGDERVSPIPSRRSTIPQVAIHASIRPLGWIRKSDIFQKRARRVMKFIREYFAAQSQDTL
jgi:diguanylate cyclase (GGDEF)-like protein/putative nucleotidyltransferase with HDIG domain